MVLCRSPVSRDLCSDTKNGLDRDNYQTNEKLKVGSKTVRIVPNLLLMLQTRN